MTGCTDSSSDSSDESGPDCNGIPGQDGSLGTPGGRPGEDGQDGNLGTPGGRPGQDGQDGLLGTLPGNVRLDDWLFNGSNPSFVSAAQVAGKYAVANGEVGDVEIRNIHQKLKDSLHMGDIRSVVPDIESVWRQRYMCHDTDSIRAFPLYGNLRWWLW